MSYSKKRHIEESNRILENRFLINEVAVPPERTLLTNVLTFLYNQTKDPKYATLKSNPNIHKKFPDTDTKNSVANALTVMHNYCKSGDDGDLKNQIHTLGIDCVKVGDYLTGEISTYIQGVGDMFGKAI
jgi:hypothetical protein